MDDKPRFIRDMEVGRTAHELDSRMAWPVALSYAAKLAAEALAREDLEEHEFWSAVYASLRPRQVEISKTL